MTPPSYWPNDGAPIVTDASAVINLNATGHAYEILKALQHPFVVPEEVVTELALGVDNGRRDAAALDRLLARGAITKVSLGTAARDAYEVLIIGSAAETLDDGEAATIALAAEIGGTPVIDETKGRRICAVRHPSLGPIGSAELLAHPRVEAAFGREMLADIVFGALTGARMHVHSTHYDWVVGLIGRERLARCSSLPRTVRG